MTQTTAWIFESLPLPDGGQLRWGVWSPSTAPEGHVLFLTGRGECIEKYSELAQEWSERGYQALSFDWRGQGGSSALHPVNFDTYLDDLAFFWHSIWQPQTKNGHAAFILGHSTGAHLALRFCGEQKNHPILNGLILSAPLVRLVTPFPYSMTKIFVALANVIAPQATVFGQGKPEPFAINPLTQDETRYTAWQDFCHQNPHLTIRGATWGWVKAAMQSEAKLYRALPLVRVPVLALLTLNDQLVNSEAQTIIPRLVPDCTVLSLPESKHEIFRERDTIRAQAWQEMDKFIKRRAAPTAGN